ncbi:hypothetical protein MF672_031420 [Actinomadura sp. ATCC 31491]|uniref:Lipoprotein n=1 Tax=Actinomadura luzonensis TaxID=2805427 RepID=A0ABT0G0Y1_9ACTN|nr:hypothetical protein [Actinomadura luzonensis]MCK2218267.1 hypothetical protein [Actinomadura luzonensis]
MSGVLALVAVPAQAAQKDPVSALKATMAPGHGVRFTDTVTWGDGLDEMGARDAKGAFQFGKKGVAAFELTMDYGDEQERVISIGKTGYYSGGVLEGRLPKGKTWLKDVGGAIPDSWAQWLNPAEPATLAALMKKGVRTGGSVTGSITLKELKAVSAWVAAAGVRKQYDGIKMSYTLTLGSSGLVNRLRTSYTVTEDGKLSEVTVDSRYTGWGSKVSIKAPDPGTVTTRYR